MFVLISIATFSTNYPSDGEKNKVIKLFDTNPKLTREYIHTQVRGKLWSNEHDTLDILNTLIQEGKIVNQNGYYMLAR